MFFVQPASFGVRIDGLYDPRGGEFQHPAHVPGGYHMPRGTQDMCPHDLSPRQRIFDCPDGSGFQANTYRPFGHGIILRLKGAHPVHQVCRPVEIRSRKLLGGQTYVGDRSHRKKQDCRG